MSSPFIDKYKTFIDISVLKNFSIDDMEYNSFAPIAIRGGSVLILSTKETNETSVKSTIVMVLNISNIKFRCISHEDFEDVINYIRPELKNNNSNILAANKTAENSEITSSNNSSSKKEETGGTEKKEDNNNFPHDKFFAKKIGEILVLKGFITDAQLGKALADSKEKKIPLGTLLVQHNFITIEQLKEALKAQQGYETVSEEELKIPSDILSLLPEDFIMENKVLPIRNDEKGLVVGMVNPNDKKVINEIILMTSLKPSIRLITYYEFLVSVKSLFDESKKTTDKLAKRIEKQSLSLRKEESLSQQAKRALQDDSDIVVKFVNLIISNGIDQGVSDIHIEPSLDGYRVRYRKDGILREALKLPKGAESAILTRLKVISEMNIAEHRRPQDGSFSITYNKKGYDFRINTLPVGSAEKMVIRILAPAVSLSSSKESLKLVGASAADIEIVKKMESSPNGIILATGPTGSGKTTTLYTLLKAINDEKINITTIEDPIEIRIDGINQSQINAKAGITFASCMRAILRQDPDVILVGEIRDIETLETAISAALTGHLVLSTLHTNSAASTITRLIDMGAKDYLVSSTLVGIIAQRLVRGLCPHCKTQTKPTRQEAEMLIAGGEKEIQEFMNQTVYKPGRCEECNFEGYKGRIGVYEILPITKEIKTLISQGAHDIQIEEAAVGAGMKTLQRACLNHIIDGNTTIEEFIRVLGPVRE